MPMPMTEYHRHHKASGTPLSPLLAMRPAVYVAIVGEMRSRWINQRTTVEVLRLYGRNTKTPVLTVAAEPAAVRQRHWL